MIWHNSAYKAAKEYDFYLSWWYLGHLMLIIRIGYYLFIVNILLISIVIYCVQYLQHYYHQDVILAERDLRLP